ncbi:hypothetical protein [Acinetobacter sp. WZC-1]|uniref:hypothetical protein n=1 Tax=Acinetobacter sp. WZC-1 TaxID=3459034 RepID=UPI00403DFEF2
MNKSEHQRSILAVLGIDIWVPRTVQSRCYLNALYRDVPAAETQSVIALQPVQFSPVQEQLSDNGQGPANQQAEKNGTDIDDIDLQIDAIPVSTAPAAQPVHAERLPEISATVVMIAPFMLQMFCMDSYALMVDATDLSAEQLRLWTSIQAAIPGTLHDVKWPFPLESFQDERGVETYIQGFLNAFCQERKILCLGTVPYRGHSESIPLPGLQEMLDAPLLKRRLWQLMQQNSV